MAEERLRALRYPNDVVDDVAQLVYLHLRIHTYAMGWTDSAVRRYVRDAGPLLDDAQRARRAATARRATSARRARCTRRMDELEARIAELREQEELDRIRPPLDGRQVMDVPRRRARARRRRGARLPARGSASTRARSARTRPTQRLAAWARERGHRAGGLSPAQSPSLRPRQMIVCGTRASAPGGRGSASTSIRKPPRVSAWNTSLDRAHVQPDGLAVALDRDGVVGEVRHAHDPADRRRRCLRRLAADAQADRMLVGEDERAAVLEDAVHLPEDPVQVADLAHRVRAEHDVDRLGPQEGEIGDVALVPLDPHRGLLAERAGAVEHSDATRRRRSSSLPGARTRPRPARHRTRGRGSACRARRRAGERRPPSGLPARSARCRWEGSRFAGTRCGPSSPCWSRLHCDDWRCPVPRVTRPGELLRTRRLAGTSAARASRRRRRRPRGHDARARGWLRQAPMLRPVPSQ